MGRLHRFLSLSFEEQRLLLSALFVMATIRAAVFVLPFGFFRIVLAKASWVLTQRFNKAACPVGRIAWAVAVASRVIPAADSCLLRATAGQALFASFGRATELHLGVARPAPGRFAAHAWLVCHGEIVLGGPDVSAYTELCGL